MCLLCLAVLLWFLLIQRLGEDADASASARHPAGVRCKVAGQVCGLEYKKAKLTIILKHSSIDTKFLNSNDFLKIIKSQKKSRIIIYTADPIELKIGNWITAEGKASLPKPPSNPGQFDMESYYQIQKFSFSISKAKIEVLYDSVDWFGQVLLSVRNRLNESLHQVLGEQYGSVMGAMLLGNSAQLDQEIKALYRIGGIIHILAISGQHISLIGTALYRLLRKSVGGFLLPCLISAGFIILYGVLTGFAVSARRAILMFLIYLLAQLLGRTYDLLSALAFSCILIIIEEPRFLYQAGFQLSVLAVLAIGLYCPLLKEIFQWQKKWLDTLMSSFIIQVVTMPCLLYWFGEFSAAGVAVNVVVLPLAGAAMLTGAAAGVLGTLAVPAGVIAAIPCRLILQLYEVLCLFAETWLGGFGVWGAPPMWKIVVYYLLLIAALWITHIKLRRMK